MMKAMLAAIFAAHLSGEATAMNRDDIVLGQSAPLSGSFRELGEAYHDGAKLYFDQVNRQGGVHGKRIRLVTLDDGYMPKRAAENTRELIHRHNALALFGHMFTSAVHASLPVATTAEVPYVAPYAGYDELYTQPANHILFMTRASFGAEMTTLMHHIETIGFTKVAPVRYDSLPGVVVQKAFEDSMRTIKRTPIGVATMVLNFENPADAVEKIASLQPAAIMLSVSGGDAVAFIRQYNAINEVMVEGLRRAGPKASRQSLTNALESMRDWDAGDFVVNYSAINHSGSNFVTTTVIGAGGHFIE
jgi:branched-chain amino acid transport system substrate-binding protein